MEEKDIHNDVWLEEWNSEWPHEFHLEKECIIGALVAKRSHRPTSGTWVLRP